MKENRERNDEKMKRKNGFTLIELLAVIVILAIIALIAVPVVMNIINRANKSAFKDSAYGILKAGELFYTDKLLENAGLTEDATFNFPDDIEGLEFKGSKPSIGTMTVRKDGKISMAITNGKYCVTKGFEDEDVTISDDITNCGLSNGGNTSKTLSDLATTGTFGTSTTTPIEVDECVISGVVCEPGIPFAIKVNATETYNFYVLNDDGNKVDLIMDRNLYSSNDEKSGNVAWISAEDYGCGSIGCSKNDKGPITALRVLKERTSGWTNIPSYTYTLENDADGLGGSSIYSPITATSTATSIISGGNPIQNVRARLPRREELTTAEVGCTTSRGSCPSWIYENLLTTGDNNTYGYWTSTACSTYASTAWFVDGYYGGIINSSGSGDLTYGKVDSVYYFGNTEDFVLGLRPVITLSK